VIWRGGRPRDFELKLDYRITAGGNSGINYRSAVVSRSRHDNQFAMKGYQCDIDGKKMSSNNYGERTPLSRRPRPDDARRRRASASRGFYVQDAESSGNSSPTTEQRHLIVRGSVATHIINGH
jgi:hypothetical protein